MEKKNVVIFIVSFIILALAGIGFFAWRGTRPIGIAQPQPMPTPQPSVEIPKDWKTYRNENMKFEIKYPPDWKVDEIENKVDERKGGVIIYKGKKIATIPGSPISPYGKTLSVGIFALGKTCGDCNRYSPKELQETKINGYRAIGTIYNNSSRSSFWIYSPFHEHVLDIGYVDDPKFGLGQEEDEQTDRLFKMILSTFRFLQ